MIPIGFYWTGSQVIMATATTSPKVAALSARPDVAVSIDAGNTPGGARALSIRGRAGVEIVDGVVEEYLAMARISMDPDVAAGFEQAVRGMYEQMARIAITPTGHASTTSAWAYAPLPAGARRAQPTLETCPADPGSQGDPGVKPAKERHE